MTMMAARSMIDPFDSSRRCFKENRSQSSLTPMSMSSCSAASSASSSTTSSPLRRHSLKDEDVRPIFAPLKREDKFRNLTLSFEEIAEDEEENATTSVPETSKPTLSGRSPYAVREILIRDHSASPRRSQSLVSSLVSPKFGRRGLVPPRLTRGFSDPVVRRKWSTGSIPENSELDGLDSLGLPPIPEACTPASPFGDSGYRPFEDDDEVLSSASSQSSLPSAE